MIQYCLMVLGVLGVICCGMGLECRFAANAIRSRRVRCQFVPRYKFSMKSIVLQIGGILAANLQTTPEWSWVRRLLCR